MRLTDPAEAAVLGEIIVRQVRPEEQARWDQLVSEQHYLENANLVGERLCYGVEYRGQWLALLGWSSAAYHVRARDTWIGWNDNQRRGRLHWVDRLGDHQFEFRAGQCRSFARTSPPVLER